MSKQKIKVLLTKNELRVIIDSLGTNNESYVFTEYEVDGYELETRLLELERSITNNE